MLKQDMPSTIVMPLDGMIEGHIVFVLSVCFSVVNFKIHYNF